MTNALGYPFTHDEIPESVRNFENCTYALNEFRHREHLAVGLAYRLQAPLETATNRLRDGLQRFSARGDHETITVFWMMLVDHVVAAHPEGTPIEALANALLERFGNPSAIFKHYSHEVLMSDRARADWIEPDLRPL